MALPRPSTFWISSPSIWFPTYTPTTEPRHDVDIYRLSTSVLTRMIDDGAYRYGFDLQAHLAVWVDGRWADTDGLPRVLVLYDLETDLERRIDTEPGGITWAALSVPWLVYGIQREQYMHALYALHLERAGILDTSSHVIAE